MRIGPSKAEAMVVSWKSYYATYFSTYSTSSPQIFLYLNTLFILLVCYRWLCLQYLRAKDGWPGNTTDRLSDGMLFPPSWIGSGKRISRCLRKHFSSFATNCLQQWLASTQDFPLMKRVAIALWKTATGSEYRMIAHLFVVSRTTICKYVQDFSDAAETLL